MSAYHFLSAATASGSYDSEVITNRPSATVSVLGEERELALAKCDLMSNSLVGGSEHLRVRYLRLEELSRALSFHIPLRDSWAYVLWVVFIIVHGRQSGHTNYFSSDVEHHLSVQSVSGIVHASRIRAHAYLQSDLRQRLARASGLLFDLQAHVASATEMLWPKQVVKSGELSGRPRVYLYVHPADRPQVSYRLVRKELMTTCWVSHQVAPITLERHSRLGSRPAV